MCFLLFLLLWVSYIAHGLAWIKCNYGDGVCPDGNTCCVSLTTSRSTCIAGHKNETSGSCCMDYDPGSTGCGSGFACAADDEREHYYCQRTSNDTTLPDQLPRYKLCSLPSAALTQVHGLSVSANASTPQLAYLSTMGALDSSQPADIQNHLRVHTLVIMIHGSGRNVDDYLCTTNSALPDDQQDPLTSSVMIVTPWFLAPEDGPVNLYSKPNTEPLRWLEDGPIYHTWRYGADAMNLPFASYAAADAIISQVASDIVRFPLLRRVVVAGHSAGGQYTQRWVLLSNLSGGVVRQNPLKTTITVRTIVANPKSYCWLDARRYIDGQYRVPTADAVDKCPEYNEWEWGLGEGNFLPTPYKDKAVQDAGGNEAIVQRYSKRDVVYLAGELDVIPNGDCMERMQGEFRRIRSERFFESLKEVYGRQVHQRLVVTGVHHDHALMFQSPEGFKALFDVSWGEVLDS